MFRYLIFAAFIYIAYKMIRSVSVRSIEPPDTARTAIGEDMVKDPNCNTYIPLKSAIVANIKGKSHYFCSKECEKEFKNQ